MPSVSEQDVGNELLKKREGQTLERLGLQWFH